MSIQNISTLLHIQHGFAMFENFVFFIVFAASIYIEENIFSRKM